MLLKTFFLIATCVSAEHALKQQQKQVFFFFQINSFFQNWSQAIWKKICLKNQEPLPVNMEKPTTGGKDSFGELFSEIYFQSSSECTPLWNLGKIEIPGLISQDGRGNLSILNLKVNTFCLLLGRLKNRILAIWLTCKISPDFRGS